MSGQLPTEQHKPEHPSMSPQELKTDTIRMDLKRLATDINYGKQLSQGKGFRIYDDSFSKLLGSNPSITQVQSRDYQFAHEAGVYIKTTNRVYFTANFQTCDPIALYSVDATSLEVGDDDFKGVVQANGACNYKDKVLYCCQGDKTNPSALVLTDPISGTSECLLNNFQGRPFNSINDVIIHHANDDIWFTDPTYGYEQAFRPSPDLPSQIYRFDPSTGRTWCVADGFVQCNGLCFSPDYKTLYVTDTGACQAHDGPGDGHNFSMNPRLPATIYSFDVTDSGTTLSNRKTFAFCDNGVPDGIKCDEEGNVYSGCGDGVQVWNSQGTLIGKIVTGGCVANFCWSKEGMWMFGEEELYLCKLGAKGTLVSIECE
jgi:gluconolactonase